MRFGILSPGSYRALLQIRNNHTCIYLLVPPDQVTKEHIKPYEETQVFPICFFQNIFPICFVLFAKSFFTKIYQKGKAHSCTIPVHTVGALPSEHPRLLIFLCYLSDSDWEDFPSCKFWIIMNKVTLVLKPESKSIMPDKCFTGIL